MKNLKVVDMAPGLYLVATPIGNLRDITLRALDVLGAADIIACEDTRVSGRLLQAYDIKQAKLAVYNDHSAPKQRQTLLDLLAQGKRVALISDAGTPLVSDPGYKLVRDAIDLGIPVVPVPGANAPLTALQLSGLPSDKFFFLGFLPPKTQARQTVLREWRDAAGTMIVFETGPRLLASLKDMRDVLGDRPAAVVREMTKMFEETKIGSLSYLIETYESAGAPKGEIVVVVGAAPDSANIPSEEEVDDILKKALRAGMSMKDAVASAVAATGLTKKKLYQRALDLAGQTKAD